MDKPKMNCWLVERYVNGRLYFLSIRGVYGINGIKRDGFGFSTDVLDAIRFARKEDAWIALTYLSNSEGRVTEHVFDLLCVT